jgi:tetratricopeptide (TPR) repeat protein
LVRKKILEDALRFYEEFLGQQNDALQLQFEVAQAMRRVGQIRVQLGRFNSASESYQRGIEMVERLVQKNPDNTVYLELLADLYEALYDSSSRGATWVARKNENSSALEQAIATRARLHRLLPDNVKHEFIAAKLQVTLAVQYHLGRSPSEACQLNDKAIEDLKRLLAANPDRHRDYVDLLAGALAFRATLSAGDGNARAAEIADDEAESEAQKFLAVNPERGQGVLGWVLFSHAQHQGDPSKRESLLRRTIAVMDNFVDAHPDSLYEPSNWAGAHSLLAGILIESGHNEEAERTLRTVVSATRLPAGVRAPLNEGAMHKTGYMVTLAELGCHRQLITLLRKLQRPDEAEAATRIWVNAWLELGQLYNALGDADRTRQAFETVLSIETESFCGHSELAKSWQQSGEPAKALVHADRAIDIEPGIVAAWETKTKCHLELGDSEAAGQAWMRWVDLTPNERHFPAPEQSLLNCIKQMARAGKLDGARNFCDVLARSHGSGPMALDSRVLTAAIFQCLGENDRAKSIVTDVIRRLESGRPADQSEADHLRIVRACLSMMIDHMDLVAISDQTLLKRLGAIAEQVIISEKSSIGDCRELGVLHATLGLFDQARRDFECAVIAGNGGRQAGWYERYLRALCYLHDGDQAAYRTAAGEILARITASQDAKELHWTVWTCVLAPGGLDDYRLLVELARRGHDLQPADSQMNQALGAALFRASQFEQALPPLSECEAAPTTSNTTPVYVRYFLAMTHHKLRHETEARQWFDRAEAETNRMLGDGKTERGQPLAWNRRLTLELLRAEARALLGEPGQPPAPIKVGAEKQGP